MMTSLPITLWDDIIARDNVSLQIKQTQLFPPKQISLTSADSDVSFAGLKGKF